jgi:hypothetical protein
MDSPEVSRFVDQIQNGDLFRIVSTIDGNWGSGDLEDIDYAQRLIQSLIDLRATVSDEDAKMLIEIRNGYEEFLESYEDEE